MIGRRLAHFEITGKLGEGGMGVVYEALDHHLNRRVALKILPPEKIADAGRKQRFIQEAKAASALNHPNIVTIYDINSADGVDYIAMEKVPGITLEDLMARRRLQIPEAMRYALQMAGALAAAHAVGVVHRDIKPANVMVADDGLVKVLDFGLAKLTEQESSPGGALTETVEGAVLGTASYMSPEQAEGKKTDVRSDIFSFGSVLYEMLSGKRAFHSDTMLATLVAVLHNEPKPLSEVAPGLAPELGKVVSGCLRKDPARRTQSMAEVKAALDELKEQSESGAAVHRVAKRMRVRLWVVVGALALALAAALTLLLPRLRTHAPLKDTPLTAYTGAQGQPAISPDGRQFAFIWDGDQEGGPRELYVKLVSGGTPLRLTTPPGVASYPSWSPDGQTIAFIRTGDPARNGLTVISALGGPERRIDEAINYRPGWSPDGKWIYFSQQTGIYAISSQGGEKSRLTEPPPSSFDFSPSVSPDGRRLAFGRQDPSDNGSNLWTLELRAANSPGSLRRLTATDDPKSTPAWSADGEDIIYAGSPGGRTDRGIFRVPASGGAPVQVDGIGENAVALAFAPKARRLIYGRSVTDWNIWRMPLAAGGGAVGSRSKVLSSTRSEESARYSPDGKRIVFASDRNGLSQIWVADADGSNPVALTNFTHGLAGTPRWSPDGKSIVFDARPEGLSDVYSISADGGAPKRLTEHRANDHNACYSADGQWVYFASARMGTEQIYRIPRDGGQAVQMTRSGSAAASLAVSADGKWIYYYRYSGQANRIWRVAAGGGEESPAPGIGDMGSASFDVTASAIYFVGPPDPASRTAPLEKLLLADGKVVEVGRFEKPIVTWAGLSVSPDEKSLLYTENDLSINDLRLVESFR